MGDYMQTELFVMTEEGEKHVGTPVKFPEQTLGHSNELDNDFAKPIEFDVKFELKETKPFQLRKLTRFSVKLPRKLKKKIKKVFNGKTELTLKYEKERYKQA